MPIDRTDCRKCLRSLSPETAVRLWDADNYCRDCVEAAMPGLSDYAEAHAHLFESAPYNRRAILKAELRIYIIVCLPFAAIFSVGFYQQLGVLGIAFGVLTAMLLIAFVAALKVPLGIWVTKRGLPTVVAEEGFIELFRGLSKKKSHGRFALQELRWRRGKARHDSMLENSTVPNQKVIILELPHRGLGLTLAIERYACGWTDEMRQRWGAFLTLADVPRAERGLVL